MNHDGIKLTAYFGERDRANGAFLADALVALYARHELQASLVLRGIEGFGARHRLQTDRLLTLSEDLPIVAVAVDARERIEAVLPEVRRMARHGVITLEGARVLTGRVDAVRLPEDLQEATKLTVYVGRQERVAGGPAHEAVVALLHRHGVAGATALLGVDGTAHGVRRRAAFFGRNAEVPVMIISVGEGARVAAALPELSTMLARPLMTVEAVRVCKRDGRRLAEPQRPAPGGDSGAGLWQKLMVYTSEQAQHDGAPLHAALVRRLRAEGAAGATALRGFWGYHGDHAPHGERFWSLRRHVPVVTVLVDRPDRIDRWFGIVDELTTRAGLVTSELVPALLPGTAGYSVDSANSSSVP
jgi:PII-like signaling protein